MVSTPALGADLGLGTGAGLFFALFTAPALLGLLVEPPLLAWSDRLDRRRVLLLALVAMTAFAGLAALTPGSAWFSVALGLWGTAVGVASGVAQGALVVDSASPERAMTRWTLWSALGDLAAPLLVGGLAWAGLGWRAAMGAAAGVSAVAALGLALQARTLGAAEEDEEDEDDDDAPRPPLRVVLAEALAAPGLLRWLGAVASCTLMDELLLSLVAIRVADQGPAASAAVFALMIGGVGGLAASGWALSRFSPRRLLGGAALASAVGLVAWVLGPGTGWSALWLVLLGAAASLHYPLAMARAYAAFPGRPGMVKALDQVVGTVELAAPLALGAVVGGAGVEVGLLVLLLQPLAVGLAAAARGAQAPARRCGFSDRIDS